MSATIALVILYLAHVSGYQFCVDETFLLTYRNYAGSGSTVNNLTVDNRPECMLSCHILSDCVSVGYAEDTGVCVLYDQAPDALSVTSQLDNNIYHRQEITSETTSISDTDTSPAMTITSTSSSTVTPTSVSTLTSVPAPTVTSTPEPTVTSSRDSTVTSPAAATVTSTPGPTTSSTRDWTGGSTEDLTTGSTRDWTVSSMQDWTQSSTGHWTVTTAPRTTIMSSPDLTSSTTPEGNDVTELATSPTTHNPGNPGNPEVRQWAAEVLSYSSQNNYGSDYAASQVVGEPDFYPEYGHSPLAWAQRYTSRYEFIELRYEVALYIQEVHVYETYNSGATWEVDIRKPSGSYLYAAFINRLSRLSESRILKLQMPPTSFTSNVIKVYVDTKFVGSFAEIDAVEVIGSLEPWTV